MENRCPNCDSTQVYVRLKTGELVCRSCGKISSQAKTKKAVKP